MSTILNSRGCSEQLFLPPFLQFFKLTFSSRNKTDITKYINNLFQVSEYYSPWVFSVIFIRDWRSQKTDLLLWDSMSDSPHFYLGNRKPPCKPNVLALSLHESPSASVTRGRKQLPNRWFIKMQKKEEENDGVTSFSCSSTRL